MKDKLDNNQQSNIVYEVPCQSCDQVYIGEISRHLKTRMDEHERDLKRKEKSPKNVSPNKLSPLSPYKTALKNHAMTHKHSFDFRKCRIIDREPNLRKRLLKRIMSHN